jgi:putative endonuclease
MVFGLGRVKDFVSRDSKLVMYYVYVLQSERDDGLYIGFTSDLSERLRQHNEGDSKSTSSRRPFELIYYEAYIIREDAEGRERFLKSGGGRRYLDKQLRCYFEEHPRQRTL